MMWRRVAMVCLAFALAGCIDKPDFAVGSGDDAVDSRATDGRGDLTVDLADGTGKPDGEAQDTVEIVDLLDTWDVADVGPDLSDVVELLDLVEVEAEVQDIPEVDEVSDDLAQDTEDVEETEDQPCIPQCEGIECGDYGCGGTCGSCTPPETCSSGHCSDPLCIDVDCGDHGYCDAANGYHLCICDQGYFNLGMVCAESDSNYVLTGEIVITSNPETFAGNVSSDIFDPIEGMPVAFVIGWDATYTYQNSCWGGGESSNCLKVGGFFSEFYLYGASQEIVAAYNVVGLEMSFDLTTQDGQPQFGGINFTTTPEGSGVFYGFEFMPFDWPLPLDDGYPVLGNISAETSTSLRRYLSPSSMSDEANGIATLEMYELGD